MPKISQKTKDRISEQILSYLFVSSPVPKFTVDVARELARDEEFTKSLLLDLEKRKLVIKVMKNPQGLDYERRTRWRLSNTTYETYKKYQQRAKQNLTDFEE